METISQTAHSDWARPSSVGGHGRAVSLSCLPCKPIPNMLDRAAELSNCRAEIASLLQDISESSAQLEASSIWGRKEELLREERNHLRQKELKLREKEAALLSAVLHIQPSDARLQSQGGGARAKPANGLEAYVEAVSSVAAGALSRSRISIACPMDILSQ